MRPGGCIAIHSTVHPDLCSELARQAAEHGLSLIDAPVSGGGGGAAAGTLTVMVGGATEAVTKAQPLFETFATLIVHLGDVGAGQMAKLVNNALMAAHVAIAHQGLEAATALGIDRDALIELVKVSSGAVLALKCVRGCHSLRPFVMVPSCWPRMSGCWQSRCPAIPRRKRFMRSLHRFWSKHCGTDYLFIQCNRRNERPAE